MQFVAMTQPCNYRTALTNEFYKTSPVVKEMCEQYASLYEYVKKNTGIQERLACGSSDDFLKLLTLHDTLKVQKEQFNFTLPSWTDAFFNDTVTAMLGKYFYIEGIDPTISKYCVGPFLHTLLEDIDFNVHKKPGETNKPKLHTFAAHDGVIVSLMRALKIYNDISPPYASALIFELYESSEDYYIKVHYKNVTDQEPYLMQMPACPNPCSLDTFRDIVDPLAPDDWEEECLQEDASSSGTPTTTTTTTTTSAPPPSSTPCQCDNRFNMPLLPRLPQLPSLPPAFGQLGMPRPQVSLTFTRSSQTPDDFTPYCKPPPEFTSKIHLIDYVRKKAKAIHWRPINDGPELPLSPFELT